MFDEKDRSLLVAGPGNPARGAVQAYLAGLGAGSRRTVRQSLDAVAWSIASDRDVTADRIAWHYLRRSHMTKLREHLALHYAPSTANKILSVLRGVLRQCSRRGLISGVDSDAVTGVSNLSAVDHQPLQEEVRHVSNDDVDAMFSACRSKRGPAGHRDAALLAILLSSGLRRTEVVALDLDDFAWGGRSHSTLRVRGEPAERTREVQLSPDATSIIRAWIEVRGNEPGPLLLAVNKAGVVIHRRLTDQAIYDIVRRLAERASVPHMTTRALRRTYVAGLIAAGLPMEQVQRLAGHAFEVTTQMYRELAKELAARKRATHVTRFLQREADDPPSAPPKEHTR